MGKGEISWKSKGPEGERREVYARPHKKGWRFFERERRFENWEQLESPPLDDWLELLDGVRRRVARRLLTPNDELQLVRTIREQFPDLPDDTL